LVLLAGHRRQAFWEVAGYAAQHDLLDGVPLNEDPTILPPPGEGGSLIADYASIGLTLGRHPIALLRNRLGRLGYSQAEVIRELQSGRMAKAAGLVIGRQRPGTASGVVFVTLEDETGCVNVIVWRALGDRQRQELLSAKLMGIEGKIERDGNVVHLIAHRITDQTVLLGKLSTQSRDFH
jgi:error-prone DNA polymerase